MRNKVPFKRLMFVQQGSKTISYAIHYSLHNYAKSFAN